MSISDYVQATPGQSVNSVTGGGTVGENMFGGGGISGPSGTAFNGQLAEANANAAQYGNQAQQYTQQGAQMQNPYEQGLVGQAAGTNANLNNIGGLLSQTAAGGGPALAAQRASMTQATDQGIAAQLGAARSATGGALAQNAAGLAAQGQIANITGNAAAQTVQQQAAAQQAAALGAGQVYGTAGGLQQQQLGTTNQTAYEQAYLQQQNQAQINQQQQAYIAAQTAQQQLGLSSLTGYSNALSGTATAGAAASPNPLSSIGALTGGIGQGAAGIASFTKGS